MIMLASVLGGGGRRGGRTRLDGLLFADFGTDGPDVDGVLAVVFDDGFAEGGGRGDEGRESGESKVLHDEENLAE